MTHLFTVRFTTEKPVNVYNARGKVTGTKMLKTPVELHGLTADKAEAYRDNPDFELAPFTGKPLTAKGNGRDMGVGSGTKRAGHVATAQATQARDLSKPKPAMPAHLVAATTGNLGAAIHA